MQAMKKFIRYLYEYQNGRRVQNAGFVKAEESGSSAVLQIYGKGFPAAGRSMEILLFYLMGDQVVGISMGMVTSSRPMFGYRLEYTPDDVGGEEIFRSIEGVIILSCVAGMEMENGRISERAPIGTGQGCRWYAATWNDSTAEIEKMMRREEILRREEMPRREESARQGETLRRKEMTSREESASQGEISRRAEERMVEENTVVPESGETGTEGERTQERIIGGEMKEENPVPPVERKEENQPSLNQEEPVALPENNKTNAAPASMQSVTESVPVGETIFKITRRDLAKLPRREWKLANNQFLMHGYRNYHHLISFKKDGYFWLGVPGIYHPREQQAASAFGFGQFMRPDIQEVKLTEEERSKREEFGYWCRVVSALIQS